MGRSTNVRTALKWVVGALGVATGAYASYVGVTWLRYGQASPANPEDADPLLDRFMPVYEVSERHHIHVAAPADITFAAACEQDLMSLPVVRAIFKTRELVLGAEPDSAEHPRGLLAMTKSIGWGVLAEVPGREIVMGAVTQPWHANVVFRETQTTGNRRPRLRACSSLAPVFRPGPRLRWPMPLSNTRKDTVLKIMNGGW
jgi:hypothetical protein